MFEPLYNEYVFLFFKTDWQPAHNERQLVKVVGPVAERPEKSALPSDIDQHAFSKFTNIYFKVNNNSSFVEYTYLQILSNKLYLG